ncbi:alpha/beta fold hydrolase [Ornithobacterium rhinotracheale]|uniref:alpha/beta fold hydrolase n=1 Tax=Ornithobacterium rhinotracheale TaxID=28251 RepID=UPI00129C90BC|nr:alpha/beta hydrolase [Ornithobacterium rhinotracheale]MCK0199339.1 alpha/beta hydrolase [Ornithobacterium rhinotracheale]MRJ08043.1 alpha/beta hydrolase [Ornithobacterium rhinotracheale]UOH78450.1 alpha/beta hydrolase [Ornithobacterium rhinotracheale]
MKVFLQLFILAISCFSCMSNLRLERGTYTEKIDGLNIYYTIKGTGPIMLVGHPNSGKIGYELTLKPLEERFTMVYYDPRGTGKSEAPLNLSDYSPENSVKEIELLRKKLNVNKIWLFGHSDQSAIALQYATKYPEHISGMILTGTSYTGTQQESMDRRRESENKRIAESEWFKKVIQDWDYMIENKTSVDEKGNDISSAPLKWWTYNEESFQKVNPIVKEISKVGRRKPINGEFYQETDEERNKYLEVQKSFKNISAKTLIINGKYDTNNPVQYVQKLHNVIPNSTLVTIDKSGHFPWIEASEDTFKEINKWLNELNNK